MDNQYNYDFPRQSIKSGQFYEDSYSNFFVPVTLDGTARGS